MMLQARPRCKQQRLGEVRSGSPCAADVVERPEAVKDTEACRKLLRDVQKELDSPVTSGQSNSIVSSCKQYRLFPARIISLF